MNEPKAKITEEELTVLQSFIKENAAWEEIIQAAVKQAAKEKVKLKSRSQEFWNGIFKKYKLDDKKKFHIHDITGEIFELAEGGKK